MLTLMGLPKVQASCVSMLETGINILNIPLISNFVNYAIGNIIPSEIIGSFSDMYQPLLQPSRLHRINDS